MRIPFVFSYLFNFINYFFDNKKFFEWAATRKFPVFISEYEIDDKRFKCIYEIDRLIKLAGKGARKIDGKKERLFWNGVML